MAYIFLILWSAFLWRLRGGLLNQITGVANWNGFNDTVVRGIYACGLTAAFWFLHPVIPNWQLLALLGALFVSSTISWFGADVHLTAPNLKYVAIISLSGTLRMALVAAALISPWPLLAGIMAGPIYWFGGKLPKPGAWCVWGELLFGAAIGVSICFI